MKTKITSVKRINKMFLAVEYEDHYPAEKGMGPHVETGIRIIPNSSCRNYNEMWEWTRIERREWYEKFGPYWDAEIERWAPKKEKK